jgi:hypothetical protein
MPLLGVMAALVAAMTLSVSRRPRIQIMNRDARHIGEQSDAILTNGYARA